ncbi:VapE domain-containing protein [Bradyrhizobium paxllaeri]|uniref:VapE domain-containing protein n=1 Tax=Bradyrhizobium paxllaeri TaxID=190148 RepID=UPI000810C9A2|nr:VapE domain-containing protein [Bradyrhizobium paxllaeri]
MTELPSPDNLAALDFLRKLYPDGPWLLTAIRVDPPGIQTRTFSPKNEGACLDWLKSRNGERNIYFSVNPPLRELSKKAERTDIREVVYLHVDIDPRANETLEVERERIEALLTTNLPPGVPAPTAIVFSGGGYQAFWKLDMPIPIGGDLELAEEAKRYNQRLEYAFGADNCHNIDRIMRVAGTINVPDARKTKKGRKPELAQLFRFEPKNVYPLASFQQAPLKSALSAVSLSLEVQLESLANIEDLTKWAVPARLIRVIREGKDSDQPKKGDNSRSGWLFYCVRQLVRHRVPTGVIAWILLNERFGIAESVLEQPDPKKYALRQIKSAHKAVAAAEAEFELHEGQPVKNLANIRIALDKLGVSVRYDVFRGECLIEGLPGHGPLLDEQALNRLWLTLEEKFNFRPAKTYFDTVLDDLAVQSTFHPVRDYLDSLVWDRKERLDGWLTTYAGAKSDDFTRAVGSIVLIAAVRRVRNPGCKFDEMLVLESGQGADKSSALELLAVNSDWFTDDLPLDANSKVAIEQLAGRWIVEAGELHGMGKGDLQHLKAFLSRQNDTARLAYAKRATRAPRQCVIVGTTNEDSYLTDVSNRRFWPVKIDRFDLDLLRRDRDQLWAEAAAREAEGARIRLDPALYEAAQVEQDSRRIEDPYREIISRALGDRRGEVRSYDLWDLIDVPAGQRNGTHAKRLGAVMKQLGWKREKARYGTGVEWCYVKGGAPRKKLVLTQGGDFRSFRYPGEAEAPF